jgi:hypothetical protein
LRSTTPHRERTTFEGGPRPKLRTNAAQTASLPQTDLYLVGATAGRIGGRPKRCCILAVLTTNDPERSSMATPSLSELTPQQQHVVVILARQQAMREVRRRRQKQGLRETLPHATLARLGQEWLHAHPELYAEATARAVRLVHSKTSQPATDDCLSGYTGSRGRVPPVLSVLIRCHGWLGHLGQSRSGGSQDASASLPTHQASPATPPLVCRQGT